MRLASTVIMIAVVAILGCGGPALALNQIVVTEPNHVVGYCADLNFAEAGSSIALI